MITPPRKKKIKKIHENEKEKEAKRKRATEGAKLAEVALFLFGMWLVEINNVKRYNNSLLLSNF